MLKGFCFTKNFILYYICNVGIAQCITAPEEKVQTNMRYRLYYNGSEPQVSSLHYRFMCVVMMIFFA